MRRERGRRRRRELRRRARMREGRERLGRRRLPPRAAPPPEPARRLRHRGAALRVVSGRVGGHRRRRPQRAHTLAHLQFRNGRSGRVVQRGSHGQRPRADSDKLRPAPSERPDEDAHRLGRGARAAPGAARGRRRRRRRGRGRAGDVTRDAVVRLALCRGRKNVVQSAEAVQRRDRRGAAFNKRRGPAAFERRALDERRGGPRVRRPLLGRRHLAEIVAEVLARLLALLRGDVSVRRRPRGLDEAPPLEAIGRLGGRVRGRGAVGRRRRRDSSTDAARRRRRRDAEGRGRAGARKRGG
mmetsp:Transcript_33481/g.101037  ORF Transcript_33481/g.101037 Transcript_33481/m.101037 type:complete len:298 (-) Transcript_33481:65-958(-)